MVSKIVKLIDKSHIPYWLGGLLVIVLVLRIPSFFEPFSYGDEMIYLALGEGIRQGIPLYSGLHDNKPPLLYILAAIAGSVFWFKAILAIWSLVTIVIFWKLAVVLFPRKERLQKIAVSIFAILTTIPLLEGNIANAELFMIGPIILAFYLLFTRKLSQKILITSGVLFSIATLFKVPAAFDLPVISVFWLITRGLKKKEIIKTIRDSGWLLIGFLVPIGLTFIWYFLRGAFGEYLIAAFLQNMGYLSSWRPADTQLPFYVRNGPLLARTAVVFLGSLLVYWKRKKLSPQFILLIIWLLFGLFAVTLSERPYPHYLVQVLGPVSLFFGLLLTDKSLTQSLAILPLILTFFVPVYYKFWYYPTTSYYVKFVKFAVGISSREEYLTTFGGNVIRNYDIADFITKVSSRRDKVFIWGDGSAIYALSRRLPPIKYVADYHIRDFSSQEETIEKLNRQLPTMIVDLPDSPVFPELRRLLNTKYLLLSNIKGADVWKLVEFEIQS